MPKSPSERLTVCEPWPKSTAKLTAAGSPSALVAGAVSEPVTEPMVPMVPSAATGVAPVPKSSAAVPRVVLLMSSGTSIDMLQWFCRALVKVRFTVCSPPSES